MKQKPTPQKTLLPGIAMMAAIALISYALNRVAPLLSPMLIAIILGVLARNLGLIHSTCENGIKFSAKTILRLGVVLLGLKLSLPQIAKLGWGTVGVIFITVGCTFLLTLLIGKAMRVPHTTTLLTATGTSICGAAAVAGVSAVTRKRGPHDEDIDDAAATAIASVTVFGTIGLLLFPFLAGTLALTLPQTGVWIGSAIHEVGQVVAGGGIAGQGLTPADAEEVLNIATVTKLGRVALLALLVALIGPLETRAHARLETLHDLATHPEKSHLEAPHKAKRKPAIMPLFVAGFLALVLVRSLLDTILGSPTGDSTYALAIHYADKTSLLLLTVAMGAMGAGVHLKTIARTGLKALGLGLISAIIAGLASLGALLVLV